MEKEISVGLHNCFEFVVTDAITGKEKGRYKAENIILNNFWGVFLSANNINVNKYIHFGSGTTEPVATDVKLTTWMGYKTSTKSWDYSQMFTDGVIKCQATCRLQDTEFQNTTIGEVGLSNGTVGTSGLLTKALVKDSNGNAITIPKGATDIIDIFSTFFVKLGGANLVVNDEVRIATCSSVVQDAAYTDNNNFLDFATFRAALVSSNGKCGYDVSRDGWFPRNTTSWDQEATTLKTIAAPTITYSSANKKVTFALANIVAASGNHDGFRSLQVGGIIIKLPCTGFSQPVLTKEVLGTGDGSTKDFACDFGWVLNNGTAKVYVNDVEQSSGVTIDYDTPPAVSDVTRLLNVVDWAKLNGTVPYVNPALGSSDGKYLNGWVIMENPYYATMPIDSFYYSGAKVEVSDDLSSWATLINSSSYNTYTVAAGNKNKRYWRYSPYNSSAYSYINQFLSSANAARKHVHFDTAPAAGATVALTYQPDCIAKDAQHVLNNVSVAITFNEYTP